MKQSLLIKTILNILVKGINGTVKWDKNALSDLNSIPNDFVLKLNSLESGNYLHLIKKQNGFFIPKPQTKTNLEITFKTDADLKRITLGKTSINEEFSRHNILVSGNINTTVIISRLINMVEYYLFPKIVTKKFPFHFKKQFCSIKLYFYVLFTKKRRIK